MRVAIALFAIALTIVVVCFTEGDLGSQLSKITDSKSEYEIFEGLNSSYQYQLSLHSKSGELIPVASTSGIDVYELEFAVDGSKYRHKLIDAANLYLLLRE